MAKNILVTGGAGYIGSHTTLQLLQGGYKVVVVDNLDNSSEIALHRVRQLAGDSGSNLTFHKVRWISATNKPLKKYFLQQSNAFSSSHYYFIIFFDMVVYILTGFFLVCLVYHRFDAVIHFAGLKAVGESVQKPLLYYNNNLISTVTLLQVMAAHGCKMLVFSSSATVYGWPKEVPCTEESPLSAANPYGRTKQVAVGRLPHLTVYGTDYNTKDGTGVRDYIHVVDLADGHIAALKKLFEADIGCEVYNLGTGKGTTVLEMVAAFEKVSGKKIPLVFAGRRPGDAEIVYASTEKAERELNWKAKYGIEDMCRDLWNWACKNPYGYGSPNQGQEQDQSQNHKE
ncbi:hypothetical protein Cgig2_026936 [Carnegiea gigantea]|uniref:UDP-glucose 4-epimerase n=1 Tax=Carnegiea gigantea TaxID=171969 RepID=A0A9Q1KZ18_9CARY|nr:hypothetical protein Cgig2_026936 [Carnegiea gigantea]